MYGELKCPNCGTKKDRVITLASNPGQYGYACDCGFVLPWYERKNPFQKITQEELEQVPS